MGHDEVFSALFFSLFFFNSTDTIERDKERARKTEREGDSFTMPTWETAYVFPPQGAVAYFGAAAADSHPNGESPKKKLAC